MSNYKRYVLGLSNNKNRSFDYKTKFILRLLTILSANYSEKIST